MISRRSFLKLSGVGLLSLYCASHDKFLRRAFAAIPGGTLDPTGITKYLTPLLIPPAMPRAAKIPRRMAKNVITMRSLCASFSSRSCQPDYPKQLCGVMARLLLRTVQLSSTRPH